MKHFMETQMVAAEVQDRIWLMLKVIPQILNGADKLPDMLGLKPGDKVVFEQEGEEIWVRPVRAQSVFARYRGFGTQGWLPVERLCCENSRAPRS